MAIRWLPDRVSKPEGHIIRTRGTCGWRIVISPIIPYDSPPCYHSSMRHLVVLFIHFIATLARLLGPRGVRSLVAESLLLKHQLLIVNRSRQRTPNLRSSDRILAGVLALWVRPTRLLRPAIVLKPSTLLAIHKAMSNQKYRLLFSSKRRKPGPKGPSAQLVHAVVEMKQRNPHWGCPRIAQQIALAFHIQIDKDVVRRILAHHYLPGKDSGGPSWLTFLGHMRDSLWSMDLFRCESAMLRTHWVLVVLDQYTRRIIGFGVHAGTVDGVALCRMSIALFEGNAGCRTSSAPITIRFIGSTNGRPTSGSIWIIFCSRPRRISKTRCSISGPTSTTIAPIPQWKGERRICLRHDQSQISARFDGNLTVDPYIRHQWLRDFPKTLDRSGIRSTLGRLPIQSSGACVLGCCALRGSDRFTPTVSIRQRHVGLLWSLGLQASMNPASSYEKHSVAWPRESRSPWSCQSLQVLSRGSIRGRAGPQEFFFTPDVFLRAEDLDPVGPPWHEYRGPPGRYRDPGRPVGLSVAKVATAAIIERGKLRSHPEFSGGYAART